MWGRGSGSGGACCRSRGGELGMLTGQACRVFHPDSKVTDHPHLCCRTIGKGSVKLPVASGPGLHEAKVPLVDDEGTVAGMVYLGLEIVPGRIGEARGPPTPPPGGMLLGLSAPHGAAVAAAGGKDEFLPSALHTPETPLTGPLAPGTISDPSQPTYGVL